MDITWDTLKLPPINLWNVPKLYKVPMVEDESPELFEKLIYDNQDKFYQLRLVVNDFRGKQYVHVR